MIGGARRAVALLVCAGLVVGACHSIDLGVFAQGPVPLSVLPLREPVTFTVGPNAGEAVPAQHGLLASYFSGAAYVQPSHGEVLDHQQVDPAVDFVWDASDTNPVIPPPAGIDHNDGDFRLPDHWPIWSIAWEGYLEAPGEGTYGLRLHVNNGGWLEMKDGSGALATVINCPGGTSFEGDCDASRELAAGRHYIRISYYNNAPSSANAIFSWQRPGDSALSVVPTEALCTQDVPTCGRPSRAFLFVHGISGDFRDPGFDALLDPIRSRYGEGALFPFQYSQDVGAGDASLACLSAPRPIPPFDSRFPVDLASGDELTRCDSNDDVGGNAVLLDQDIRDLAGRFDHVTIIANSMGGAITRAYLAYATLTSSPSLGLLDGVLFIQAAHAGSYLPVVDNWVDANPVLAPVGHAIEDAVKESKHIEVHRPAFTDLTPDSVVYRFVNQDQYVPHGLDYANVASDITVHALFVVPGRLFPIAFGIGDYLILPGDDRPSATPPLGGARFVPGVVGLGRSSTQWILPADVDVVVLGPLPIPLGNIFDIPQSHLAIGGRLDQIRVTGIFGQARSLDHALREWLISLEGVSP